MTEKADKVQIIVTEEPDTDDLIKSDAVKSKETEDGNVEDHLHIEKETTTISPQEKKGVWKALRHS